MKIHIYILISSVLFLSGCATTVGEKVAGLSVGTEKSEVIELLGSPKHTDRRSSVDIWTYVYFEDDLKKNAKVYLTNGKVISPKKAKNIFAKAGRLNSNGQKNPKTEKEFIEYKKSLKKVKKKTESGFEDL